MMATVPEVKTPRLFVVVNAKAGSSAPDQVRQHMISRWSRAGTDLEIHETSDGEDILTVVRCAIERGFDTLIAAGGDGTTSAVANGVLGSSACLGIIPLGTANVLARELNLPLDLPAACALLTGPHDIASIDAMSVDGKHYFTQIGIGVDAFMIRDTPTEHKKWLGVAAYVWTATLRLIGFRRAGFRFRPMAGVHAPEQYRLCSSIVEPWVPLDCGGGPACGLTMARSTFASCEPKRCWIS